MVVAVVEDLEVVDAVEEEASEEEEEEEVVVDVDSEVGIFSCFENFFVFSDMKVPVCKMLEFIFFFVYL